MLHLTIEPIYELAHKELRIKYAQSEQVRKIVNEREVLSRKVAPITEQLRKFFDTESLPGQCELCS
jgi:hypothetical protein